jgi:hypothetical protein
LWELAKLLDSPSGTVNSTPAEYSEEPGFDPYVINDMINHALSQTFTETRELFYTASREAYCVSDRIETGQFLTKVP